MSISQPHNNDQQHTVIKLHSSTDDSQQHPCATHLAALKHHLTAFIDSVTSDANQDELALWELIEVAQEFETTLRLRNLMDLHLVQTLLSPAGIAAIGTRNTTRFLVDRLGISPREAKERVRAAELDGDIEPDNSKESLSPDAAAEPEPPLTDEEFAAEKAHQEQQARKRDANARDAWDATANGRLTAETRSAIRMELSNLLPGGTMTAEDVKSKVYAELDKLNTTEIRALTRKLVDESNDTVNKPKDPFADQRRRSVFVSKPDRNGNVKMGGILDAASATLALKLFGQYAKRGYGTHVDAIDDKRSLGQLNADALAKILRDAMAQANSRTNNRGGLASIVAVADAADFADPDTSDTGNSGSNPWWNRKFHTNVGTSLNAIQLLRLGVTDNMLLSLIDTRDGMAPIDLALFRGQRIASFEQRIALQILDGGCQHPGCDQPIDQCDIHHILAFIVGGGTDIENLVPMCRTHHRQNDDTQRARNRSHMCPRTPKTNFRSGSVRIDENGHREPPKFNTGPMAQQAPGYVPPPEPGTRPSSGRPPSSGAPPNPDRPPSSGRPPGPARST